MSSLIDRLQALKQQLQSERLALPPLRHVRIQWPDGGEVPSRCPVSLPPRLHFDAVRSGHRAIVFARDIRVYPDWVTMHYLETRSRAADPLERTHEAVRIRPLLSEAGRIVALIPGVSPAASRPKAESCWLLGLHDLLEPDQRFTWNVELPLFAGRNPVFSKNLSTARAERVHQCEIIEDAVLASVLGIDELLARLSEAGVDTPAAKPKEPSPDALKAYQLSRLLGQKQADIAATMTAELGRPIKQPRVSRWITEVRTFLKAGGVISNELKPDKIKSGRTAVIDPAVLQRGARQDGRARRQRPRSE